MIIFSFYQLSLSPIRTVQVELAQEGLQSENYNIKSEITIIQDKFSKKSFHTVHDTSEEINDNIATNERRKRKEKEKKEKGGEKQREKHRDRERSGSKDREKERKRSISKEKDKER
ncbi:hypothetical protein DICPUDRAFT_81804 [Dictyostelium purpureum]|uniref:Uncharacterized protein n=1 Tax=Dictyostelium purpureum TaxID=5786 RepID=F0ZUM7_DICPU|nr:uncharacterized protein DICPUDRAFT_81804 [Dictyostelium purpureum]EGC32360.1 hypothetical protein DICPUDRAFT_81804 [Dictyostelium purpureum]|eukprot:XP_003291125.1 hypothetical protein DICPUDRAFT_81804 [Dictyostelium purpureum]